MIKCPFCTTENEDGANWCKSCRESIGGADSSPMMQGSPKDTKKCPYCDELIQEGALKCRYCKEWLVDKESDEEGSAADLKELFAGADAYAIGQPTEEPAQEEQKTDTPNEPVEKEEATAAKKAAIIKIGGKKRKKLYWILVCLLLILLATGAFLYIWFVGI